MTEETAAVAATKVAIGAAAGAVSGLRNVAAPHVQGIGAGAVNASSNFCNGAAKALRSHKGIGGALAAGTAAVAGHGAVAAVVVAAAPAVAVTAVAAGAMLGAYKLVKFFKGE